ncbi:flagellar protein FlaG [Herbaspirillum sp. WKF16]|jgi:flagellar protein FlaG|uniref:flagellar protein FlaG n=1 Tax=Herbaspirillum sp. WKF16 TaxID=3028312 RepID=UPI0023A9D876|nr:flagellar protein FlaG [Herbaspirillum sp. WKF16]WDZ98048.1 flagellar protein FlaG [Herbaspirillum sp. WKF16]
MAIAPLNISAAGDSGTAYALPQAAAKADPVVSTVAPAASPEARRATESDVNDAVGKLNDFAAKNASALNFSKDQDTGKTIVKVVDTATDTVIRQIPTEEAVAIAKSIDKMQGLLINHKA